MKTNGGIDGYVFYNNKNIKQLDLSNCRYNLYFKEHSFDGSSIKNIILADNFYIHLMEYAFANTSQLTQLVNFKLGAYSKTNNAFYNSSIEQVIITEASSTVQNLGKSMFEKCTQLHYVDYPSTITKFEEKAFKNCESLEEFVIKESITNIEKDCFDGCVNLHSITSYPTTAPTTVAYSFGQISSLTYAGYATQNRTDDYGRPYNKLYIPTNNTGYLSNDGVGLNG